MAYRVAICDDEQEYLEKLKEVVHSWSAQNAQPCEVRIFGSAEACLFCYEDDNA